MMGRLTLMCVAVAVAACRPPAPPSKPVAVPVSQVRIRVFTEPEAPRAVVRVDGVVLAASARGLDRWDLATGQAVRMRAGAGLPSDNVRALAADGARHRAWVATDAGLGLYDVRNDTYIEVPSPPDPRPAPPEGMEPVVRADEPIALAATDGGVWVGNASGLWFGTSSGQWSPTATTVPVHMLALDEDGWLWIATDDELVARSPGGEVIRFAGDDKRSIAQVTGLGRAPGGGVFIFGTSADGLARAARGRRGQLTHYRLPAELKAARLVGDGFVTFAAAGGHLWRILPRLPKATRPLGRGVLKLAPLVTSGEPYDVELMATTQSPITAIALDRDAIWVGTQALGIGRYARRAAKIDRWLRRGQMFDGAERLTVACVQRQDCWVSMGTRQAWRWRGDRFEAGGPDQVVLAVVRGPDGAVYAVHRTSDAAILQLARIDGETWTPVPAVIKPPGKAPSVSFARFAPDGRLWLGLLYREDGNELPWGVGIVDLETGKVGYHRALAQKPKRGPVMKPIPVGVVDAAFVDDDDVWFATSEGAAHLEGEAVTLYSERNALRSELLRAIARGPDGTVYAASSAGVAMYKAGVWSYPRGLTGPSTDVAVGASNKLWVAADRGLLLFDGAKVRRIDSRRGLVDDEQLDVAVDQFGRVWSRGAGSLTLITP